MARWIFVAFFVAATWLLLAGNLHVQEIAAAAIVGVLSALGDDALRRRTGWLHTGLGAGLRHLPGVLRDSYADCWRVTVVLAGTLSGQRPAGSFRRIPYPVGPGEADPGGRRALATLTSSLAPNSYLVGFNREAGEVLIHQLRPSAGDPLGRFRRPG